FEGKHAPIQGEHRQSNATLEHQINLVAGITAGKNQLVDAEAGGGHLPCDQKSIALGKGLKQDRAAKHGRNWPICAHARSNAAASQKFQPTSASQQIFSQYASGANVGDANPGLSPTRKQDTSVRTLHILSSARFTLPGNAVPGTPRRI